MTPSEVKDLYDLLKRVAPLVAFSVTCERDDEYVWDGDGPEPDDMFPVNVDVKATTIIDGELMEGFGYLIGHYVADENKDPGDIGGYLIGLLEDATKDLLDQTPPNHQVVSQLQKALESLKTYSHYDYHS